MTRWAIAPFILGVVTIASADSGAIDGYTNDVSLVDRLRKLDAPPLVKVTSLAKTEGGRDVSLITIGTEDVTKKPAILVVGNVVAPHIVGSEIAIGMAEWLVSHASDEAVKKLLDANTIYIIPRPNPDGTERFFGAPRHEVDGNARRTDDDRDFSTGEDPPNDLNGDGFITVTRMEDPTGDQIVHPDEPRVLITADPKKGEKGTYRVLVEGTDQDKDRLWNEDGTYGVSTNRNFTAKYPFFGIAAGPNQVSESETRAIANFCFDHPNIAAILVFSPEDNLFFPWKPGGDEKIKTKVQADDAPLMEYLAKKYQELHGGKEPPPSPEGAGSFSDWAYLHFGRWTFSARAWWIPPAEKDEKEKPASDEKPKEGANPPKAEDKTKDDNKPEADAKTVVDDKTKADDASKVDDKSKPDDKAKKKEKEEREALALRALKWFEEQKIDGFVLWTPIEHPDFPGRKVEVGGFKPFLRLNPPAREISGLVEKHAKFLSEISNALPRLSIVDTVITPQGNGVYRVRINIANVGYLPTKSQMGGINGIPLPLNWELKLAGGASLVTGNARGQLPILKGGGGQSELEWLILAPTPAAQQPTFSVTSPAVGRVEQVIELERKS